MISIINKGLDTNVQVSRYTNSIIVSYNKNLSLWDIKLDQLTILVLLNAFGTLLNFLSRRVSGKRYAFLVLCTRKSTRKFIYYGYKRKEKEREGRERNGGVSYDQVIIRNKINIAKEIIKKKQRNDKTILPSNYAQMKKGKGRGGGENNGANSFIIHEFFKVIINVGITRIVSYLFPFFYFFFFSLLNSKKGIGINFHMQHISHYTYMFSSKNN